jgi:hypothetical protein
VPAGGEQVVDQGPRPATDSTCHEDVTGLDRSPGGVSRDVKAVVVLDSSDAVSLLRYRR